jgi:hypothetical protein
MKAKKPLVVAVLLLVPLILVLMLPSAAAGTSDATPAHWATWGTSTGSAVPGWQGVAAFNVRELTGGTYNGFALFQSVRRYPGGSLFRTSSFEEVRFTENSVTFVVRMDGKFWAGPGAPIEGMEWAKITAFDGGPGHAYDTIEMWFDMDPTSHDHSIDSTYWDTIPFHIGPTPTGQAVTVH